MVGRSLKSRVEALEQVVKPFAGFASIPVYERQTVEEAKADWESQNGSIGDRQVVLWNFGGLGNVAG